MQQQQLAQVLLSYFMIDACFDELELLVQRFSFGLLQKDTLLLILGVLASNIITNGKLVEFYNCGIAERTMEY